MRVGKVLLLLVISFIFMGCSKTPECSDSSVKELVFDISKTELRRQLEGSYQDSSVVDKVKMGLDSIRTQEVNKDTGARSCAGELSFTGEKGTKKFPITYTVEATDDGDMYVNVYGL